MVWQFSHVECTFAGFNKQLRNSSKAVICVRGPFTDDVSGTVFAFEVYFADIFTDNAKAEKLNAAHKAYDTYSTCPAGYGIAEQIAYDCPYNPDKAEKGNQDTKHGDHPDWFERKACNSVKGKCKHFFQWIMVFSGNTFLTSVVYTCAFKAHKRNHSAQKQIDLFKFSELPENSV